MLTRPTRTAAVVAAAMLVGGPVCACSVCYLANNSFSVPHPHAVRIALATRSALDDGTIKAAKRGGLSTAEAAEFEASLAQLAYQLTYPYQAQAQAAVDVLLIDDSAFYRVELNGLRSRVARIAVGKHTPTPLRIVTTTPVVDAVGRFELRVAEAVEKGLVEVEASEQPSVGPPAVDDRDSTAQLSSPASQ